MMMSSTSAAAADDDDVDDDGDGDAIHLSKLGVIFLFVERPTRGGSWEVWEKTTLFT